VFRLRAGIRYVLRECLYFLRFDGPPLIKDLAPRRQCTFMSTCFTPVQALTKYVCAMTTARGHFIKPFGRIPEPMRGTASEAQTLWDRSNVRLCES
jgi:hypothetical protein